MGLLGEFKEFLYEYKVIGLAIAFIIGAAVNSLVQSLVKDIVMPIVNPLIPGGNWEEAVLAVGPVSLRWGSFLSALINFVVIALVVFFIAKKLLKEEKVSKK
jgi:large conductance mechanosensitive channel